MTERYLRLQLRAFNGECDAIIGKITCRNLESSEARVERAFHGINKLGEPHQCRIVQAYCSLKAQELYLAHQYEEMKQDEKDEQRRIRQEMKEAERAEREIERARREASFISCRTTSSIMRIARFPPCVC